MELRRTPLYNYLKAKGGKFVPFAGWEMAVQFQGIVQEHNQVRNKVGMFDVSHMGEIICSGKDASTFLNFACSNNIAKVDVGYAQYSLILSQLGGVIDDIIIYRRKADEYLLCVNASNKDKDFKWLTYLLSQIEKAAENSKFDINLKDASDDFGQIALQGPKAVEILNKISGGVFLDRPAFSFVEVESPYDKTEKIIIARTGYTGEDGGEVFISATHIEKFVTELIDNFPQISLCGLGARDTLRLEAAYPLHGHELRDDMPAGICRVGFAIDKKSSNKFGLARALADSFLTLTGFIAESGLIPREGMKIYDKEAYVGWVTSGTRTPTLEKSILLAFVEKDYLNSELEVDVRGKRVKITKATLPFYKRES